MDSFYTFNLQTGESFAKYPITNNMIDFVNKYKPIPLVDVDKSKRYTKLPLTSLFVIDYLERNNTPVECFFIIGGDATEFVCGEFE